MKLILVVGTRKELVMVVSICMNNATNHSHFHAHHHCHNIIMIHDSLHHNANSFKIRITSLLVLLWFIVLLETLSGIDRKQNIY